MVNFLHSETDMGPWIWYDEGLSLLIALKSDHMTAHTVYPSSGWRQPDVLAEFPEVIAPVVTVTPKFTKRFAHVGNLYKLPMVGLTKLAIEWCSEIADEIRDKTDDALGMHQDDNHALIDTER